MQRIVLSSVSVLLFIVTFLFLSLDTFGAYDTSIRRFGVSSTFILILFLLANIFFAFLNHHYFPKKFNLLNKKVLFPLLTIPSFLFILINHFTYETFILNLLHLKPETFVLLAILSGSVTYINHSKNQSLYQKIIYFVGPLILITFILMDYLANYLFRLLVAEDGIIENIQFVFYLVAALIFTRTLFKFYKNKQLLNFVLFSVLTLGLFFIAFEEISWGQRLFGITTPEAIKETNWQGELNIHNQGFFQSKIEYLYMALGLIASLSGVVLHNFYDKFQKKYHLIIPSTLTFFYFFSIFVYYFLNQYLVFYYQIFSAEKIGMGRWQEVAELFLSTAFLIFAISVYKKIKREASFLNKPNLEENPIIG